MSNLTLSDLSTSWQDFILDMINLDQNSPAKGSENGVTLMIYATGKEGDTITGNFLKGSNSEMFFNALNSLLKNCPDVIPIFVAASLNCIKHLESDEQKILLEHIKKFLEIENK